MDPSSQLAAALSGRYEVEREIGAGGMATVYLARDVRHNRRVAVKVLKPELGAVLGVERFLAEIEVTANLQHPNLLPLFDSGEANGLLFYVMPFVEGESLRARLDREKQLPVDDAVQIAVAVASGLAYAHERGVIHRDLKPENILLQAGQPLIADFGIALAVSNAGGARITQTGLSLGTPHYMSPEQATGDRTVDGRTDVYSLGSVLFEMLTGDPPHTASTAQAIIAKVLTERPASVRMTRATVPEHIAGAIDRALEKLAADRWSTAREFADALQGRGAFSTTTMMAAAGFPRSRADLWGRLRDPVAMSLGAVAVASLGVAAFVARRAQDAAPSTPIRFVLTTTANARPIFTGTWPAAASPNGQEIVYTGEAPAGGTQLYIRRIDALDARPLPGTVGATQAVFSPDGKWLAYLADGKLRKLQVDGGGTPVVLTDANSNDGADWTPNGDIILGAEHRNGLGRISANGGTIVDVTKADSVGGQTQHLWPVVLDDGNTVVFAIAHGVNRQESRIAIGSLSDGKFTALDVHGIRPLGIVNGSLVYLQLDGTLMAARVDVRARRLLGPPLPLLDSIPVCGSCNGDSGVHLSKSGVLTYMRGTVASTLAMLDSTGLERAIATEAKAFSQPRLSPDGRHIAITLLSETGTDVWIYDIGAQVFSKLTAGARSGYPEWTPDGKRVVFVTTDSVGRSSLRWQPFDGGAPSETLISIEALGKRAARLYDGVVSPDGRNLVFETARNAGDQFDIWTVPLDGKREPRPYVVSTSSSASAPRISPDGHWVAYTGDESGRTEVYVRSFPDPSNRVQVSADGGVNPVWSRDGKQLYYRLNAAVYEATLAPGPSFAIAARRRLFEKPMTESYYAASYDVGAGRGQILALRPIPDALKLVVVMNWPAELAARMASSR
jgi:serine/threonine-protein kinase